MKIKIILLIILINFSSTFLFAQDTTSPYPQKGISLMPSFFMISNISGLNNELKAVNYPQVLNYGEKISLEIMGQNIKDTAYGSMELTYINMESHLPINNINVGLSEFQYMLNLHVDISYFLKNKPADKRKFQLEPYLGIGFSFGILRAVNEQVETQPFDSSLSKLNGEKSFTSNITFLINPGISIQKSISKKSNWFLGIRSGYEVALNKPRWQENNAPVASGPRINMGGFYAGLTLSYYPLKRISKN